MAFFPSQSSQSNPPANTDTLVTVQRGGAKLDGRKIVPTALKRPFSTRMAPLIPTVRFPKDRSGTTVVETALVLPVFLFIVFAIIEFGHVQMVINVMQNACRNGARVGTTEGISTADVVARVDQTCSSAFATASVSTFVLDAGVLDSGGSVPTTGLEIEALPPIELSDAEPRQMFVVRATVPYNDIALIPMPFMKDIVLNGQSFMRHE